MIRRIDRVANYGILQKWRCSSDVTSFEHCNVIYGPNGSGKSTLASLLAAAASRSAAGYQPVFRMTGPQGTNVSLSLNDPLWDRVYAFNAQYIDQNLQFDGDSSSADYLLQVGKTRIDAEARKTEIRERLSAIDGELNAAATAQSKTEGERTKLLTDTARNIARQLAPFGQRYEARSYNASAVRQVLTERVSELQDWQTVDVQAELKLANSKDMEPVSFAEGSIDLSGLIDDVRAILNNTATSQPIADLVNHPDWASWVHQGLGLHKGQDACIYCHGVISELRKNELNAHFDESLTRLTSQLAALRDRIASQRETLKKLSGGLPSDRDIDPSLHKDLIQAKTELSKASQSAQAILATLAEEITRKEKSPFFPLTLVTITGDCVVSRSKLKDIVDKHNKIVSEGLARRSKAAELAELAMIGEIQTKAGELAADAEQHGTTQSKLRDEQALLKGKLANLSAEDLDPEPLANALNGDLKILLGRDELKFEVADNGYRITRSGHPAHGLSEGERNAISLLYFLRSLEEHHVTLSEAIVVIDDPVSSLDSNNLLAASSFIWSRLINTCAQLFLFTHNFELFRTWSQLLKGANRALEQSDKHSVMYELRAKYQSSDGEFCRVVELRNWPKQPEASRLRSEYHYLFGQVLDGLSALEADPSEAELMNTAALLPNATRRVLEGFLAFKRPQSIGDLRNQLKGVKPPDLDDALWQGILRFANEYSHMEDADTDRHLERPEVQGHLQAVLSFISAVDRSHVSDVCEALDRSVPEFLATKRS